MKQFETVTASIIDRMFIMINSNNEVGVCCSQGGLVYVILLGACLKKKNAHKTKRLEECIFVQLKIIMVVGMIGDFF